MRELGRREQKNRIPERWTESGALHGEVSRENDRATLSGECLLFNFNLFVP
jgi:hypothetical protein